MNKFKKLIVGALALVMVLSFTGCGNKDTGPVMNKDGSIMSYSEDEIPEGLFVKTGDKYYPLLRTGSPEENYRWFTKYDNLIPEFSKDSKFVFYSNGEIPQAFNFWKMIDFGYTVGIRFVQNQGALTFPSEKELYCPSSPVGPYVVNRTFNGEIKNVRIKEVNGKEFKETMLTTDGFMKGLTKDAMYKFWYYQGTVYKSVNIKADTHVFIEDYDMSTASYIELKDKVFEINLPVGMENGYYYIDGFGMFKYTGAAEKDLISDDNSSVGEITPPQDLPLPEEPSTESEVTPEETQENSTEETPPEEPTSVETPPSEESTPSE